MSAAPLTISTRTIGTTARTIGTTVPAATTSIAAPAVQYAAPAVQTYTSAPAAAPVVTYVSAGTNVSRPAVQYTASAITVPTMAQASVVGAPKTAAWGGGCPWQSDKTAFMTWVQAAINNPGGEERKELYGFLCECFMDADNDRDGMIGFEDFDFLIEDAAALPRRFGLAPSWPEMYGDEAHRRQGRMQMFTQMDRHGRGLIGMEEWVAFTINHITEKVRGLQAKPRTVDFAHLAGVSTDEFVNYCEKAVSDKHSEEYKSLYEHLFKVFVESDVEERGLVHFENFDRLIEDAAQAPRALGLAPTTAQAYPSEAAKVAARKQEFDAMDFDRSGGIPFNNFLRWAVEHIAGKVRDYRTGIRHSAPAAQPIASAANRCPVSGQVVGVCPVSQMRVGVSTSPSTFTRVAGSQVAGGYVSYTR